MKALTWMLMLMLVAGCSTTSRIDGASVLLAPQTQSRSLAPEQVVVYLEPPEQDYQGVAMVVASATVTSYSDVALIEAELLNELKRQAAAVGANGIVDVVREVIAGDQTLSVSGWDVATRNNLTDADVRLRQFISNQRTEGRISSDYLIVYRARAVDTSSD